MRDLTEDLLEVNRTENEGTDSVAQAFVGTDGIMMKVPTIDAVKQYGDLEGSGTLLNSSNHRDIAVRRFIDKTSETREQVCLSKIQVIVGTKSMKAGINGTSLKFAKCNRFPRVSMN